MKVAVLTGYDKNGRELELRDLPASTPAMPAFLSGEEAACVPLTALTALQSLELMGSKGKTILKMS